MIRPDPQACGRARSAAIFARLSFALPSRSDNFGDYRIALSFLLREYLPLETHSALGLDDARNIDNRVDE
jgi:hypothetical protein